MGCFNVYQIRAWEPGLDRSNLTRWVKRGYLSKLRQDWYEKNSLVTCSNTDYRLHKKQRDFRTDYGTENVYHHW